ncbi:phage baseplate assembly protein V [Pseudomonas sp. 5P_3.1_Bac2]|uniref:phage baseplate assembly protein V n=1 Tax=Pseudomonas sp. 5P_3.1_Bac2 TaxID=2971617 RepID=UPI0021C868AC|nr:phage baseplate assembly protein V [Pseudomonas sp. 5P_3.1_Bac2]MCU1717426.1 phage baseplate assembly protein V [Pseudomonas sp. 5P_3.1_Bac2]
MNNADLLRRLENLIRPGTIAEVDLRAARCRVRSGGLLSAWLPWLAERAGSTRQWNPPSVGEQCLLLSPSGSPEYGFVLLGLFSAANPAPANSASLTRQLFADGAQIDYDHQSHRLSAILPAGGSASVQAPGGITLTGNVTINGQLNVSQDVLAGAQAISLTKHLHGGIMPGAGLTGVPNP